MVRYRAPPTPSPRRRILLETIARMRADASSRAHNAASRAHNAAVVAAVTTAVGGSRVNRAFEEAYAHIGTLQPRQSQRGHADEYKGHRLYKHMSVLHEPGALKTRLFVRPHLGRPGRSWTLPYDPNRQIVRPKTPLVAAAAPAAAAPKKRKAARHPRKRKGTPSRSHLF